MRKGIKIIIIVSVISIIAKLLGFLREVMISAQYGTTLVNDAITIAYTIPNFLYLVLGGALTTSFISVYHSSKQDKKLFVRKAFTTVLFASVFITSFFILFREPLIDFFYRNTKSEEYESTYILTRSLFFWMMPSAIVLILSTWMSGLLNVLGKFYLPSIAILIYNCSFIVIGWLFTNIYGAQSYGIGAFFGALLMGLFLYIGIQKSRIYSLKPSFDVSIDIKRMWVIALPILFGGASVQLYFVIHRIFASMLGEGAVTIVNLASKMTGLPQGILMTAITTVIYPLLSKKEDEGNEKVIRSLYKKGLFYLFILFLPTTIVAYYFSEPLVRLVFHHGSFSEQSVLEMAPIFRIFTLSMFFLSANTYITRFYYAKGNSLIPVIFSLICVFIVNIGIIIMLQEKLDASAIAYGTSISTAVNFLMLVIYANWKWKL
jgi:putative peptidoglycan lipid II flippase